MNAAHWLTSARQPLVLTCHQVSAQVPLAPGAEHLELLALRRRTGIQQVAIFESDHSTIRCVLEADKREEKRMFHVCFSEKVYVNLKIIYNK